MSAPSFSFRPSRPRRGPAIAALALLASLALVPLPIARAQSVWPLNDYATASSFLPQTPSVSGGAAGALANPAAWATTDAAEMAIWWDDRSLRRDTLDNWGFAYGRRLGVAVDSRVLPTAAGPRRVTDWQIGLAGGDRRRHYGLAWRWSSGDGGGPPRERAVALGAVGRPAAWLSCGAAGLASLQSDARQAVLDVGVRPLGRPWLTVFADYALRDGQAWRDGRWGAGLEIRPVPGLHLGVKRVGGGAGGEPLASGPATADGRGTTVNIGVTLGGTGLHALPRYDRDGRRVATSYLVRLRPPYRSLRAPDALRPGRRPLYVPVDLEGRQLTYQRYRLFDDQRVGWLELAERLDALRDADGVRGVVLNLAGASARPSLVWELRRKLLELRAAGKEVIVHADRLDPRLAYAAAAADRLSLDPQGDVTLAGFALRRTYLKGALDKLGIGFQELRYFPYKSAVEVYARDEMSPGDREQRARVADVLYEEVRDGICAGRRLAPARFDSLVDGPALLSAAEAVAAGLADTLARWPDLPDWLRARRPGARLGPPPAGATRRYHDEAWGRPPEIAVVYAVGECDLETGIRGRATAAHLRRLAARRDVAAVVLRADSPGGDPLPSDLVAEACAKLVAAGKPVVVSQGDVAASGGYWLGLAGSRVLTTPLTLTGSIGVIAGWYYDAGLAGKAGLRADGVQRGEHADLLAGVRLPLLGLTLPERPLSAEELARVEQYILAMYDQFVGKVAAGRRLTPERVRELGGGRVWMGRDAVDRQLADGEGGLTDAIALARELAGIPPGAEAILAEFPPRPWLRWPQLTPSLPRLGAALAAAVGLGNRTGGTGGGASPAAALAAGDDGYDERYLERLGRSAGRPQAMVPPDLLPPGWAGPD